MKAWMYVLLIGLLFVGFGCTTQPPQNPQMTEDNTENTNVDEQGDKTTFECMKELGHEGLLFIYSPTCPHCHRMQPIVDELMNEGLNFEKLNSFDDSAKINEVNNKCVKLQPYVPQFVCPTNGKIKVGEMSKEALEQFYNSCFGS